MYFALQVKTTPQALALRDKGLQPRALSVARRRTDRRSSVVTASKKGVGTFYFEHNDSSLASLSPEASWYYTWSSSPSNVSGTNTPTNGGGLEFVPMIWGVHTDPHQPKDNRTIKSELDRLYRNGGTLLDYNEPDGKNLHGGQSNIDVSTAADNWHKLEATGKRLGSPATAERAWETKSWMQRFMHEVDTRSLRVDFICLHWYPGNQTSMTDPDAAAQELEHYMNWVHDKWGKPIWLTEFAYIDYNHDRPAYPSIKNQAAFAKAAVYKLEHLSFVERYAWYALPNGDGISGENNGLFQDNGSISEVGTAYKNAKG